MPSTRTLESLMAELDGADADTVNRIAWREGSLPVRLAMLGLASVRKGRSPLWWGYPPGVFIGYKWGGEALRAQVLALAEHVRARGYRAMVDVEHLDAAADAYFQIPAFITSLQDCSFYVLLLTARSADMLTAREGKTTWVFDEFQHALRLSRAGRLFIVPVLLEPDGLIDAFTRDQVIDLCASPGDFTRLDAVLTPSPLALLAADVDALADAMARFDRLFLGAQWQASADVLHEAARFEATFDHGFRRLLHAIYTADVAGVEAVQGQLNADVGPAAVQHLYRGYCAQHGIPDRSTRA